MNNLTGYLSGKLVYAERKIGELSNALSREKKRTILLSVASIALLIGSIARNAKLDNDILNEEEPELEEGE